MDSSHNEVSCVLNKVKMIPKIIHQIWIGDKPIPSKYAEWHEKLKVLNPNWEVKLWKDKEFADYNLTLDVFYGKFWSHASVSNMLRLFIVGAQGGIYLDMDMEPHRPLDSVRQVYGNAFAADQGDGRICNAAFGAPPNHPWIEWQIKHGAGDAHPHDAAWGVYTITKAPREDVHIVPTELFYPYHYEAKPELRKPTESTICEHHWDKNW